MRTEIHWAKYDWIRTACGKRVVSGLTVATKKSAATCLRCINA